MSAIDSRDMLIERRELNADENLWQKLTLSQHFSASSLTNFGYQLSFIRSSEAGSLAVLTKDCYCTTVADNGEINSSPVIHVRT